MTKKKIKKRFMQSPDRLIKCLLGFVIIWLLGSIFFVAITSWMLRTVTIGSATQEEVYPTYGFISTKSYLLNSPITGEGTKIAPEGFRVRKNEAVFSVSGVAGSAMQSQMKKIIYTPISGLVSYHLDGYETYNTLDQVATLDLKALHTASTSPGKTKTVGAQEGVPYAKIVNNLVDIHLFVPCASTNYTQQLAVSDLIKVRMPEIGLETTGKILASNKDAQGVDEPVSRNASPEVPAAKQASDSSTQTPNKGENPAFYLEIDLGDVSQTVLGQRIFKIELPFNETRVISIPQKAVVYRDGAPGVYYVKKGHVLWQAIEIKETLDNDVVVTNLSEGTEVITTPKLVNEGKKVRIKG